MDRRCSALEEVFPAIEIHTVVEILVDSMFGARVDARASKKGTKGAAALATRCFEENVVRSNRRIGEW